MKTVITQELLKKERGAKISGLGLLLLAAVFCLACILLIPVRLLGIGVAVVVAAIALGIWTKVRKQEGRGDIAKAYFRLLPLSGKKEYEDHDDNGNVNSVTLCLQFGEYGEVETPRRDAFEAAQPGDPYYVAFYSETDRAFACFAAEAFEPDGSFQIRQ